MPFKEYIENEYIDLIKRTLSINILEIIDDFSLISTNLASITITKLYVGDYTKETLKLAIIVKSLINATVQYNYIFKRKKLVKYFLINATCDFNEEIKNFKILSIEQYRKLPKFETCYSTSLIPYINKEKLDDYAKKILNEYYPEVLKGKILDPIELANRLGLNIIYEDFENNNIMGQIFFADYSYTKMTKFGEKTILIPKNSIVISSKAHFMNLGRSESFTIVHECLHYILHRKAMELERYFNKDIIKIECFCSGLGKSNTITSPVDWMEWQANNLAARMLLFRDSLIAVTEKLLVTFKEHYTTEDLRPYYEDIISTISKYYHVSKQSVKIRLVECGYDFPIGTYIYVDDNHVIPHSFKHGSLKYNETYSIGLIDACNFVVANHDKADILRNFIYVESHFCLISSKFLKRDGEKITLTDYALSHMDECCLKFTVDVPAKIQHYDSGLKQYCVLNRSRKNQNNIMVGAANNFEHCHDTIDFNSLERGFIEERNLYSQMNMSVKNCLKVLREYSGLTIEKIIEQTGLSKTTIDKYFYNENFTYDKVVITKILVVLSAPPSCSDHILKLCGVSFSTNNSNEQRLYFAINHIWNRSFEQKNLFFQQYNM